METTWHKLFKLLSFRLDYKKEKELKTAILYFFSVFVFLRLLALGLNQTQFFSLVLTIGAVVYLIAAVHYCHVLFEKKVAKKYLSFYNAVFGILYALMLIWIIYLMFAPITIGSENTVLSLISSLLLIILPASFSDEIIAGIKDKLFPLFFVPSMPNLNLTDIQNFISGNLPNLNSPFPYIDIINNLISKYGLFFLIAVIVVAIFSLRTIKLILQILLIAIIIWAIVRFLGIF